jgi:hypothetical protein
MILLYKQICDVCGRSFETNAAIRVGNAVRDELDNAKCAGDDRHTAPTMSPRPDRESHAAPRSCPLVSRQPHYLSRRQRFAGQSSGRAKVIPPDPIGETISRS